MRPVLNPREQQVALQVGLGLTNPEIAAVLHLAPNTVKTHVSNIMRATGIHTRSALVADVWRSGFLRLPLEAVR